MANFPRPNSEEGKIANAIECIEYSDELDQHDVKRLMTAAIRKCEDPSVCRDFINALCKREDELQDENMAKASEELYHALKNYFAAGCTLGVFTIDSSVGRVLFDSDDIDEMKYLELQCDDVDKIQDLFWLPYLPLPIMCEIEK